MVELSRRQIEYLRCSDRKCGFSYRSSCRRNSGVELAKGLRAMGLLYLHDGGEHKKQGRYVWRTTDKGKAILKGLIK